MSTVQSGRNQFTRFPDNETAIRFCEHLIAVTHKPLDLLVLSSDDTTVARWVGGKRIY